MLSILTQSSGFPKEPDWPQRGSETHSWFIHLDLKINSGTQTQPLDLGHLSEARGVTLGVTLLISISSNACCKKVAVVGSAVWTSTPDTQQTKRGEGRLGYFPAQVLPHYM